jgi:hypothetical protein
MTAAARRAFRIEVEAWRVDSMTPDDPAWLREAFEGGKLYWQGGESPYVTVPAKSCSYGQKMYAHLGDWVVMFDDGKMSVFDDERFKEAYEEIDPQGGQGEPVAWLHVLHCEHDQTIKRLSFQPGHDFGDPGKDYDDDYHVTSEPLYRRR